MRYGIYAAGLVISVVASGCKSRPPPIDPTKEEARSNLAASSSSFSAADDRMSRFIRCLDARGKEVERRVLDEAKSGGSVTTYLGLEFSSKKAIMEKIGTSSNVDSSIVEKCWLLADQRVDDKCDKWTIDLEGALGASSEYGSGWLVLKKNESFLDRDTLVLFVGGTAKQIAVRLLPNGASAGDPTGLVPGHYAPLNGLLRVPVFQTKHNIFQISVHGGEKPWGLIDLGVGNGNATLEGVRVERLCRTP